VKTAQGYPDLVYAQLAREHPALKLVQNAHTEYRAALVTGSEQAVLDACRTGSRSHSVTAKNDRYPAGRLTCASGGRVSQMRPVCGGPAQVEVRANPASDLCHDDRVIDCIPGLLASGGAPDVLCQHLSCLIAEPAEQLIGRVEIHMAKPYGIVLAELELANARQ